MERIFISRSFLSVRVRSRFGWSSGSRDEVGDEGRGIRVGQIMDGQPQMPRWLGLLVEGELVAGAGQPSAAHELLGDGACGARELDPETETVGVGGVES